MCARTIAVITFLEFLQATVNPFDGTTLSSENRFTAHSKLGHTTLKWTAGGAGEAPNTVNVTSL